MFISFYFSLFSKNFPNTVFSGVLCSLVCLTKPVLAEVPTDEHEFKNASAPAVAVNGAAEHNIIRQAVNNQIRLNNLGYGLDDSYDFSQQAKPASALMNVRDTQAMQASAAAHAQTCTFEHTGAPYGQNLFAGTGTSWTIEHAVNSWAYEARHYDYDNNTCVSGEQCGHYTQIVWDNGRDVGCVIQQCSQMTNRSGAAIFGGRSGVMIVCHYDPPGNIYTHWPYEKAQGTSTTNLTVKLKVLLQGAYQPTNQLMRVGLAVPLSEPYTNLGHSVSGTRQLNNNLLQTTGRNAIVDWMLVELRDAQNPTQILASQSVLVQRDGDLVSPVDGSDSLVFEGRNTGNYHLAVRHRNHLGTMTAQPVALSASPVSVDFSALSTSVWGQAARVNLAGKAVLWAGDVNHDGKIIIVGEANDTGAILETVLLSAGNTGFSANYIAQGHLNTDVGMDGKIIFAGENNDTNVIQRNVLLHPRNTSYSANFIITQQLP